MSVRASLAMLMILAGAAQAQPTPDRPAKGKRKVAQAPAVKVTCDVIEISASTGKEASIDPALKKLEKKLGASMWSFNQYKMLSQSSKTLEKGKPESLGLKDGSGTAKLIETVDKSKVRLTITEDHGGKRLIDTTTTIAAGDWLIQGHPVPPNKDGHLVALSCK